MYTMTNMSNHCIVNCYIKRPCPHVFWSCFTGTIYTVSKRIVIHSTYLHTLHLFMQLRLTPIKNLYY